MGRTTSFTFIFPDEQLAENLTLVRTVSLAARGTDDKVRLNLRYENSGSVPIRLTHRVVIPKELAESIDELTMSVPFARIINPDIEGELEIEIVVARWSRWWSRPSRRSTRSGPAPLPRCGRWVSSWGR